MARALRLSGALDDDPDEDSDPQFHYQLLGDGGVRWNSVYYMIKRALQLRTAIGLFFHRFRPTDNDDDDISQDALSEDDWHQLELFSTLLKPFKDLTRHMEGNANKAGLEGSHGALLETLKSMDYDETDKTPLYRTAIALHPSMKYDFFNEYWAKHPNWISRAKSSVHNLYERYEATWIEEDAAARRAAAQATESTEDSPSEDDFVKFGRVTTRFTQVNGKRRKIASELEAFMELGVTESKVKDPLAWWLEKGGKWPILQRMALDLFSIPAMSSECERVFSQTKRIITDERNCLNNITVESIECQKHWMRAGLFDEGGGWEKLYDI